MSKVTVHGEGFRKDSPVLLNAIKCMKPSVESNYPFENGVRSLVHLVGLHFAAFVDLLQDFLSC